MCFSASASFAAAGVTAMAGLGAIVQSRTGGQRLLAGIPLFFAAHQFAEGLLWLSLSGSAVPALARPAMFAFLTVAEIVWPIWVPLAIHAVEPDRARRHLLSLLRTLGIGLALVHTYGLLVFPTSAAVVGQHIQYRLDTPPLFRWSTDVAYALVTVLVPLLSTSRLIRTMGALVLVSLIFSKAVFFHSFISVWCFFAAFISVLIVALVFRRAPRTLEATGSGRAG